MLLCNLSKPYKNTMTERNVLKVEYTEYHLFKIPVGIDLEDKTHVESYNVIWNKLYINLVNGNTIEIYPDQTRQSPVDYKYPTNTEIICAEEIYDDDEEWDN
jgi:hypothetical protein